MSDEDKANSLKLLNAIQTNGEKSDGVFKPTYDALVDFIATTNGTTSEVIYTNFAQNGSINWSSFLNANVQAMAPRGIEILLNAKFGAF